MKLNKLPTRALAATLGLASAAFIVANPAAAQENYPAKPIRLLVGFAAGGGSDVVARLIAKPLGERLGQAVVVENRPGAGGNIASHTTAQAAPDGYTMILMTSGHASNAAMKKDLAFDPVKDFAWISTVTTYPLTLAVKPDSSLKSFEDFVEQIKAQPNRYTYTSVGVGTAMHLVGEWIMSQSGGSALHVPFKGGAAPMTELLAGRVDVMIDTMTNTAPLFNDKRVRVLATTAPLGTSVLAGVPTVAATYPEVVFESWLGIAVPAGTSPAIQSRLNKELRAVIEQPEVQRQLTAWGGSPTPSSGTEFKARVERDIQRLQTIVKDRKIAIQ
ncbi:MAG TPA: tripartite tricarboxylate transporter substrate binding protein [Eoetvoesiella sp.]